MILDSNMGYLTSLLMTTFCNSYITRQLHIKVFRQAMKRSLLLFPIRGSLISLKLDHIQNGIDWSQERIRGFLTSFGMTVSFFGIRRRSGDSIGNSGEKENAYTNRRFFSFLLSINDLSFRALARNPCLIISDSRYSFYPK
jgi:hypothetical protein